MKAGLHTVGVTFLATNDVPGSELNRPFQRTMNTPGSIPGFLFYPHVGQVWIEGPYNAAGASNTAARQKIFVCRPATTREEERLRAHHHFHAREACLPPPGHRRGSGDV